MKTIAQAMAGFVTLLLNVGSLYRNPVISSDALRTKMGGRKMVKIPTIGSYLHKMKVILLQFLRCL